jgi:hypothetical protein
MKPKLISSLAIALLLLPAAIPANGAGADGGAHVFATHNVGGSGGFAYSATLPSYGYSGNSGPSPIYIYNGASTITAVGSVNIEVQKDLALLGYYQGPLDGNVAPGSRAFVAITSYQRDHRLPQTGGIDGNLLGSLNGQ